MHIVTDDEYNRLIACRNIVLNLNKADQVDDGEAAPLPLLQDQVDQINRTIAEEEWNK